mmetsp:Transcript_17829/g.22976  ORF Transcript_17829/g.22976 Transcript_17829/m.22976 type:complete len:268 (-) Transcript_17829:816-1619(-)
MEIVAIHLCHLGGNLLHLEILIGNHFTVQLNSEQPRRHLLRVQFFIRHVIVLLHKLFILVNNCVFQIRVVVDLSGLSDIPKSGELQLRLDTLSILLIMSALFTKVDCQGRCPHIRCHVDDLLQTGDTESHILGRHTRIMKSIQGHLGGGLSQRLGGNNTSHFTRVNPGPKEAGRDLPHNPGEGILGEAMIAQHALAGEGRPQHDVEIQGGVLLRRLADVVLSHHHHQLLRKLLHPVDHLLWVQSGWFIHVNIKHPLRIPDQPLHVHW